MGGGGGPFTQGVALGYVLLPLRGDVPLRGTLIWFYGVWKLEFLFLRAVAPNISNS